MSEQIYLDNNATTQPDNVVIETMMPYLTSDYGNPSSVHHRGVTAEKAVNESRRLVANYLDCEEDEIYFTSGATEANNLILREIARQESSSGHIVTTAVEHASVRDVLIQLEKAGYEVTWVAPDRQGAISADQIAAAVREDTLLVSVMHVNNETGVMFPVEETARRIKTDCESPPIIHVDGVQAFGKYPVDLTPIDVYTISGHKVHAPKGIGAFYLDRKLHIPPLLRGGDQERQMRSGTENVPGIVGLGKAAELMHERRENMLRRLKQIRRSLVKVLDPIDGVRINTALDHSLPTTLNVSFPPIPGEIIVNALSEKGIYVSSGSACTSRKEADSHVLKAMGIHEKYIRSNVRFSFSRMTRLEEVKHTGATLKRLLPRLEKVAKIKN